MRHFFRRVEGHLEQKHEPVVRRGKQCRVVSLYSQNEKYYEKGGYHNYSLYEYDPETRELVVKRQTTKSLGLVKEKEKLGDESQSQSLAAALREQKEQEQMNDEFYNYLERKWGGAVGDVLPVYGESGSENDFDVDLWRQMERENRSLERIRRPTKVLSQSDVITALNAGIVEVAMRYRDTKLVKLAECTGWREWRKAKKEKRRKQVAANSKNRIKELQTRLDDQKKEFLKTGMQWTSASQVRRQCRGNMSLTIEDIEREKWMVELMEGPKPPRPEKKVKVPKPVVESGDGDVEMGDAEDGEVELDGDESDADTIGSETDGFDDEDDDEDLGGFIVNDNVTEANAPTPDEEMEAQFVPETVDSDDDDEEDSQQPRPPRKRNQIKSAEIIEDSDDDDDDDNDDAFHNAPLPPSPPPQAAPRFHRNATIDDSVAGVSEIGDDEDQRARDKVRMSHPPLRTPAVKDEPPSTQHPLKRPAKDIICLDLTQSLPKNKGDAVQIDLTASDDEVLDDSPEVSPADALDQTRDQVLGMLVDRLHLSLAIRLKDEFEHALMSDTDNKNLHRWVKMVCRRRQKPDIEILRDIRTTIRNTNEPNSTIELTHISGLYRPICNMYFGWYKAKPNINATKAIKNADGAHLDKKVNWEKFVPLALEKIKIIHNIGDLKQGSMQPPQTNLSTGARRQGLLDKSVSSSTASVLCSRKRSFSTDELIILSDDSDNGAASEADTSYVAGDSETSHRIKKRRKPLKIIEDETAKATRLKIETLNRNRARRLKQQEHKAIMSGRELGVTDGKVVINLGHYEKYANVYAAERIGMKLKKHQAEGINFMWEQVVGAAKEAKEGAAGALLAHTMGLGKTLQV